MEELCVDATEEQKEVFHKFVEKIAAYDAQITKGIAPRWSLVLLGLIAIGALAVCTAGENASIIPLNP